MTQADARIEHALFQAGRSCLGRPQSQKARVLLRLALLKQRSNADLQRLFSEY